MVLAIVGTLLYKGIVDYKWIAIALVLGSIIGVPLGNVAMTAVPQRTALSHAFGALCVTLVAPRSSICAPPTFRGSSCRCCRWKSSWARSLSPAA